MRPSPGAGSGGERAAEVIVRIRAEVDASMEEALKQLQEAGAGPEDAPGGVRLPMGPRGLLRQRIVQQKLADLTGNEDVRADAAAAVRRAERAVQRAVQEEQGDPGTPGAPRRSLFDVLARSVRLYYMGGKVGVSVSPMSLFQGIMGYLGGAEKAASAGGMVGVLGSIATKLSGIGAILSGILAAYRLFMGMVQQALGWSMAGFSTGGKGRPEFGSLGVLVGGPEAFAQGSRMLASQLGRDPWAQVFGAQIGIVNPLGATPFSDIRNEPENYRRLLKAFMEADQMQAMRMARVFEQLEGVSWIRNLSPHLQQEAIEQELQSKGIVRENAMYRMSADAEYRVRKFGTAIHRGLAGAFWLSVDSMVAPWAKLAEMIGQALGTRAAGGKGGKEEKDKKAAEDIEKLSKSANRAATALDLMAAELHGLFGAGDRARGAIPPGLAGLNLNDAAIRDSVNLGAFVL